jgi:tRNA U34 5-carboxymethylaminomethyl modifying GTPase MnmE/TrmE
MTAGPALEASALGDGRTIVAMATAPGRGALAIVRLSGPDVSTIAERLLQPAPQTARQATRSRVINPSEAVVRVLEITGTLDYLVYGREVTW